jgi:acetylornithine/N-succinyldiaminopimelate aminotransferase
MANLDQAALLALAEKHLYPNYRQAPCVFVRGRGCEVWDKAGKRYLDLAAGVAVSSLGHAHPRYVAAISEQVGRLVHMSNYFYNEPCILLADELCRRTGMDRALFCNSGTEANEALLKLARHHFFLRGQRERVRVIAFEESFHGRTLGALSMTGRTKYREGFGPYEGGGVTHVPFGDLDAVKRAMGPDVAAIITEPVQGEGGVVIPPAGFLAELRALCDAHGALLLLDEVQTGIGRTGSFLACQQVGVQADAIALAKGLGGGFPIGAMVCRENLAGALPPGSHGTTYGGNPLASAAALSVLSTLDEQNLIELAKKKGETLSRLLNGLSRAHGDKVGPERGIGLLRALPLKGIEPRTMLALLRERGVLLIVGGEDALRFCPPLVISEAELEEGVRVIDEVLHSVRPSKPVIAEGLRA